MSKTKNAKKSEFIKTRYSLINNHVNDIYSLGPKHLFVQKALYMNVVTAIKPSFKSLETWGVHNHSNINLIEVRT